ncbi:hypothetical protein SBOR_1025 [Sclerotinia borealis F-4128]|uniref:Uncharacterized protein n=1 Tax=Sclerotinia borealis (strain F-4128) TaxID=1432307 RepID=W9CVK5_SCLBF|nr:hypothetical protein SBOR_1025 [Sclerotinia borealis F-4128]
MPPKPLQPLPYPILSPRAQIPIIDLRPSLTARILTPWIVFITLIVLLLATVAGIVLSVEIFGERSGNGSEKDLPIGLRAGTGILLGGCTSTLLYLILHITASIQNAPVGFVRPPELAVHAYSFIVARITLVCWMISIIVSSIIISKPKVCRLGTRDCRLQIGEIVVEGVGFIAIGIILTALEACQYPFQLPTTSTTLPDTIDCRVSSFGDDLVDSNLTSLNPSAANILQSHAQFISPSTSNDSIASFHDDYLFMGNEKEEWEKNQSLAIANASITSTTNIKRKPVPAGTTLESALPKSESQSLMTSIPGEFPEERSITPLLPTPALTRATSKSKLNFRGWGFDWSYLVRDTGTDEKCLSHSDSAISMGSNLSTECANCASCATSASTKQMTSSLAAQRMARQRNVTPSSSISDIAMRSPLFTMRTAESPDVAIRPDVALVPTTIPSSLDRISPRKPPVTQPLPIAVLNEMVIRRPSVPPPIRMPRPPPTTERSPIPPKHVTPLKRKPIETKATKQFKSWKDSLPISGGSFEIERKHVATTNNVAYSKQKKSEPKSIPKQKASEVRPSLKSWKDSLPIRGGSFEMERSTASIRDIFPNISRGRIENKQSSTNSKQVPLKAKKNPETRKPTKQSNTAIVVKKKSTEIRIPGAFVDYAKQETPEERPTSREIRVPGASIESTPFDHDKNQEEEEEEESMMHKKSQGIRPLKLRRKVKVIEEAIPVEKAKVKTKTNPKPVEISSVDEPETLYVPAPRGPRDRPFKRKLFGRSNVGVVPRNDRDSTLLLDAVKVEYTKVKPLRRLSLGGGVEWNGEFVG